MKRTDLTWAAILVLLIAASVYEMPHIMGALRGLRNRFIIDAEEHVTWVLPDRLVAVDPEAGDILRYHLKTVLSEDAPAELRRLVQKYPENQHLLSRLAEATVRSEPNQSEEALAMVDRLRTMDPNNAYYRYLRGWVLLRTPPGEEHPDEALHEFALGHDLPRLTLPYVRYKPRVDRLAEMAHLGQFDRPMIRPFYQYLHIAARIPLADIVRLASLRSPTDSTEHALDRAFQDAYRRQIDSMARIAERAMASACDVHSLQSAAELAKDVEETRLREVDLTETEAWQARLRLSQAIARDYRHWQWDSDGRRIERTFLSALSWAILVGSFLHTLYHRWRGASRTSLEPRAFSATGCGLAILVCLVAFLALYRAPQSRLFLPSLTDMLWLIVLLLWVFGACGLARVAGMTHPPQRRRWVIGFGLLVINGVVLLLIANSRFFWTRTFAGWSEHVDVFVAWLIFCLLLWLGAGRRALVFGRYHRMFAVGVVVLWAGFLLAFDLAAAAWRCESRVYAEPLSVCGPLPAATEETYNRVIRDAPPLRVGDAHPHPLPEYVEYMTPADFEALLARRRDEGHPITKFELRRLMDDSARDLHPILEKERELLNAATPSPPAS